MRGWGKPQGEAHLGVSWGQLPHRVDAFGAGGQEPSGTYVWLRYVTGTVAARAVSLLGAGTKDTLPVPEQGSVREVGMATLTP